MGQAASITFANKSNVLYDPNDFSSRFKKATLSTISVPMVIVAFPILNAYTFSEYEYTGVKMIDGTVGGLLGVVGWPLSPFVALWSAYQTIFAESPEKPLDISEETKFNARRAIGLCCNKFYNVAVVGSAGTGKSTLVNALLGLHDTDPRAAPTGEASAFCNEPRGYRHSEMNSMVVWDMPGGGTCTHNSATYFEDMHLKAFDSLVIVTAERLQSIDLDIAVKAQEHDVPAIQSKMKRYARDGTNKELSHNVLWAKAVGDLVKEVRKTTYRQLRDNNISSKRLFLLSALNMRELVSTFTSRSSQQNDVRLIDEHRFIHTVFRSVSRRRKRPSVFNSDQITFPPAQRDSGVEMMLKQQQRVLVQP
ncbi:hypothetical protein [Parasitella parasitica]|uniref:IRG-type G domain-containing protein n=1 Tax=Parasitella parasitica TaxID=35722 RepID=A0A0B7N0C6_9FUNG|nr:hypothetical protein [Parasitella parasitica]